MKFSLLSAVLFSIGWMSVVVASGDDRRSGSCCLKVTDTRVPVENIVKYEMQESTGICALRAVRFHTKRNIVICSDPDSKYAKRIMDIVDGRTTGKPTICNTSTTNTITTVTTTNKTPGTETSKSTTSSRIVTTIETSRPETETSKTTNQPTSVPKENPESSLRTMTTCGKGGATSSSTETRHKAPVPGNDLPGTCCLTVTNTRVPVENIVKYEIQESTGICALRAVRFYTKGSKTICSDPDSKYAKRIMDIVDGRTTAKPTMCNTSTTNTILTVTLKNKTPGTQTSTRNGGPESCCNNVTTNTIPAKSILKNSIKSRSKKRLHKFQAGVWPKSSGAFV